MAAWYLPVSVRSTVAVQILPSIGRCSSAFTQPIFDLRLVDPAHAGAVGVELDPLRPLPRLATVFRLETREAGAPGEKIVEGSAKIADRLFSVRLSTAPYRCPNAF
jgi:hypothetical protein